MSPQFQDSQQNFDKISFLSDQVPYFYLKWVIQTRITGEILMKGKARQVDLLVLASLDLLLLFWKYFFLGGGGFSGSQLLD
jgi:hypothetical protein